MTVIRERPLTKELGHQYHMLLVDLPSSLSFPEDPVVLEVLEQTKENHIVIFQIPLITLISELQSIAETHRGMSLVRTLLSP